MDNQIRYQKAKQVTLIGAVVNAALGIAKVIIGWVGHSHALMADGIHSFSDLVTDALVLVASRFGSQGADLEHPYGHGRIETAATLFLSILLSTVGVGIMYDASWHVLYHPQVTFNWMVVTAAILAIVSKELLFHYTQYIGKVIRSELIIANAWHHRSDAWSSIVVLIAVIAVYIGFDYADALAAVIVGAMIVKMGWSLGWSSIQELIDKGADPQLLINLKNSIEATPGVLCVHQLRTRSMSGKILADVHIQVQSEISVSEGHHIAQCVHYSLVENFDEVFDVTVHVDPEDDELASPSVNLPHRNEVDRMLRERWQQVPWHEEIGELVLHYLNGKIIVDLLIPIELSQVASASELLTQLTAPLSDLVWLDRCRLRFVSVTE